MAHVVFTAGAVMVLIGALAIITGYPIIQVERGWATVIAGTSLLAGGMVTMALALVLRALMDLRLAMAMPERAGGSYESSAGAITDRDVEPIFASRSEPATSDATSVYHDTAILGVSALAIPVALRSSRETGETNHVGAQLEDDGQPMPAANEAHVEARAGDEGEHEASAPPLDDWLDRAFADLHEPITSEPAHAAHTTPPQPAEALAPLIENAPATQLHDDHLEAHADAYSGHRHEATAYADAVAHAEPAHAEPAHAEPAHADAPTSAVIGRYEADGTSYTMYADGSIDAQSDIGVYRFASMADLKAFIEG